MARSDIKALILAHQDGVWRYLRYLGCDRVLADDLTQETFLQVLRRGFEERDEQSTAAFLRTVARNFFLMSVRKGTSTVSADEIDLADAAWERSQGDRSEERLEALRLCLEGIQGRARQALTMQYTQRRAGEAIAAALAMSPESVRVMLHRAKQALKKCVEGKLKE